MGADKSLIRYSIVRSDADKGEPNMHELAQRFVDENIRREVRGRNDMVTLLILVGDRLSCCDELVAARTEKDELIGLCTLSSEGESRDGQAGIVAAAVKATYQKQGIGMELLERGIHRLQERIASGETRGPIRVDCVSMEGAKLVHRLLREKPELQGFLDVHDLSYWLKDLEHE